MKFSNLVIFTLIFTFCPAALANNDSRLERINNINGSAEPSIGDLDFLARTASPSDPLVAPAQIALVKIAKDHPSILTRYIHAVGATAEGRPVHAASADRLMANLILTAELYPNILRSLVSDGAITRRSLRKALGPLQTSKQLPIVKDLISLGIREPELAEVLIDTLAAPSVSLDDRIHIMNQLIVFGPMGELSKKAIVELQRFLRLNVDNKYKIRAIDTLGSIRDQDSVETLWNFLGTEQNPELRNAAELALDVLLADGNLKAPSLLRRFARAAHCEWLLK